MEKEKRLKASNIKIISGVIIAVLIILIASISIYRHESNKFFTSVNTDIVSLNSNISGFKNGIAENAEFLNPSFIQIYQKNFQNIENNLKQNEGSFFNTNQSNAVLTKEIAKAEYYGDITGFTQDIVNSKDNFKPLINIENNGGKLTKDQVTTLQNALSNLENSPNLTNAMNVYNTNNLSTDTFIKSPYVLKQKIQNLSENLPNLNFSKPQTKTSIVWSDNLI
ncbi:MAG: hypothetical protein ACRCYE_12800 [Sarcina sp.]